MILCEFFSWHKFFRNAVYFSASESHIANVAFFLWIKYVWAFVLFENR